LKRYFFMVFALVGCGSEYGVSVAFDDATLAAQSVRFQVAVVRSCITIDLGERPVAPLQIVEFAADEAARSLGELAPGDYGLYARAIDENCGVIAAGCQPIRVDAGGEGTLRVVLTAAGGDLCSATSACVSGQCTTSGVDGGAPDALDAGGACPDGQLFCGGICVPSDAANCGSCGNTCEFDNGTGACELGVCTISACDEEFLDCDDSLENGCESSVQDPSTCGECGTTCDPARAPICSTLTEPNSCVSDCGAATQCGGSCVDVQSNLLHCGECNAVCFVPTATSACAAGECTISACNEGLEDCDGALVTGCETDVASDAMNCGACGNTCEAGLQCRAGVCAGYIGVDVGPSHACAIQEDQSVWCWGRNDRGQASLEVGTSLEAPTQFLVRAATPWSVQKIVVGARHTCAINMDDAIECTGDNSLGQIGNNAGGGGPTNVASADGTFSRRQFEELAAGANHTCAIDASSGAWCWGDDQYGQRATVGAPTGANLISFGARVAVDVATSDNASCFLLDDMRVHCAGKNDQGQLGRRTLSEFESTALAVRLDSGVTLVGVQQLVAGAQGFCAIVAGGRLYCWGKNDDSEIDRAIDGPVAAATEVTASAADTFVFDGTICWRTPVGGGEVSCRGRRRDGQFPGTVTAAPAELDTRLAVLDAIRGVVAGHSAACGFRGGALTCWGASYEGVIPRESLNIERPTLLLARGVTPALGWTDITLSSNGGCGLNSGRVPRCWGDGQYGALGDGSQLTAAEPVAVDGSGVRRVFRGEFGTGVLDDGDSIEWTGTERVAGLFGNTQLSPRLTTLPRPTGFSSVFRHGCALTAPSSRPTGTVICWGENEFGQTGHSATTPAIVFNGILSEHVASVVRTGEDFSCSLDGSGKVRCWGHNRLGQLGEPGAGSSSMSPVDVSDVPSRMEQLVVGRRHACASSPSNGLYCWGANESGQVGGDVSASAAPRQLREINEPTAISAGANFTCAISSEGLECWGGNGRYQIGDGTTDIRLEPTPVALDSALGSPTDVVSAPMGYGSCALLGEEWWCWGANDYSGLSAGVSGIFNPPTAIAF
jgi:alpha-tubulin suppressor-like RCC1 family protein